MSDNTFVSKAVEEELVIEKTNLSEIDSDSSEDLEDLLKILNEDSDEGDNVLLDESSINEIINEAATIEKKKETILEENTESKDSSKKRTRKNTKKTVKRNLGSQTVAGSKSDEILRLYKEGKSNVAIAKELGIGVGEVKLVIDLANM